VFAGAPIICEKLMWLLYVLAKSYSDIFFVVSFVVASSVYFLGIIAD